MGRLKQVKPQIKSLSPMINMNKRRSQPAAFGNDRSFEKTARWQRLRWDVLVRDEFTCQWAGCGITHSDTSKLVADHKVPVRIAPERKFDMTNLQCLCSNCHSGPKQQMELAIYGPA